ncbi:MAG TPA: dipeptide epimerase [Steroidobacter sp.]|uniref:dipeptide epimerase n=1 Tax=Steroidobacter sp. TaxID=1978227 RepID=UPI002EDA1F03
MSMRVSIHTERWATRRPFRIASYPPVVEATVAVVELHEGSVCGRGEASGVYYKHETPARIVDQVKDLVDAGAINSGLDRISLQTILPAGGARNALDCALWELEARRSGQPVWKLAGLPSPRPLLTTYTIGADTPAEMAAQALRFADARAIKLKLTGEAEDADRVRAVRAARSDVWLAVDANQGFTPDSLDVLMSVLVAARVSLIEQPFPIGRERDMQGLQSPIALAADESAQTVDDLEPLVGLFDIVNIKLDKSGGLTHGLAMAREAQRLGLRTMVGNMGGTSWAQAPAFLIGQCCEVVDLDGPLLLAGDRTPGVVYRDGLVHCPDEVWGGPSH